MEPSHFLRHQIIKNKVIRHTGIGMAEAIFLWEKLALQIISIVGEGGFNSLYARSIFLTQATFPWLAMDLLSAQNDHRFAELRTRFEAQTPDQVGTANTLLLITFTDLLASLIGEQLTLSILRSAWGNDDTDLIGKERKNE